MSKFVIRKATENDAESLLKAVPEAVLSEPLFCESELPEAEPPQPVSAVASIAPARSILSVFFMVKSSPLFPPNQHILSGVEISSVFSSPIPIIYSRRLRSERNVR